MEVSKFNCEIHTAVPPRLILNVFSVEQVAYVAPTASLG